MFDGVAIITGGTSGIGLALTENLLLSGASIAICGRSGPRLKSAMTRLELFAHRVLPVQADVTDRDSVRTLVSRTVEKFGRVDALVNSAGSGFLGPIGETPDDAIQRLLDTNVKGSFLACQEVWPHFTEQKSGLIVNLCGILGIKPLGQAALYCATKHALFGMGNALAMEGKRSGIRVTNVCCSGVETPFWEGVPGKPRTELLLTAEEVASSIAELMGRPAHLVTNQLVLQHTAHQL